METELRNIAIIQTGYFAKPSMGGDYVYLQVKHFDENGQFINSLHPDLSKNNIPDKHILKKDDVLFAAKGNKNFAVCYKLSLLALASTSFFVVRLHDKRVLPEFLAWFLNHPNTQKVLKGKAIGTAISSISKSVLETLEIPIPEMQTQQTILKIAQLQNKKNILQDRIKTLNEYHINQSIFNILRS